MAIGTVSGTTYTPGTTTEVMDDVMSGFKSPFMAENQVATQQTTLFTALVWGVIGLLIGRTMSS